MHNLLVLNFFPAFTPASSGGELRFGKLYRALSKTHCITMLTSTDFGARFEEIEHTPGLRELRFPKDELWRAAYATLDRLDLQGDLAGLAFALAVAEPSCALRLKARELAAAADLVIHEFPYSEPIFNDVCPVPEVYNAHNFEASLLSAIVSGNGFAQALQKLIRLEQNLVARAQHIYATSPDDAEKFHLFYGVAPEKLSVCPNGFDAPELAPIAAARAAAEQTPAARPSLLFFGSGHHPNLEAAEFLVEIAPDLPDCDIIIAGGVCAALAQRALPPNLQLFGSFNAAEKAKLLQEARLFINPVILGSGTSLKALEALGAGLPMVSTPEGVRGLGLTPGTHCAIAPRSQFTAAIQHLLQDAPASATLAAAGLALAQRNFSWDRIASALSETLFAAPRPEAAPKPFVLVINDYAVLHEGSGGIARVRSLAAHIECAVLLLSFGTAFEAVLIAPAVLHVTVPKTAPHLAFEAAINENQEMSVNDAVASLFAGSNHILVQLATNICRRAGAVVFEHPYMAPLLDAIRQANPGIPVIYSAHNAEATHKADILRTHSLRGVLVSFIAALEARLVAQASLIICCTAADAQHFSAAAAPVIIAANGCTIPLPAPPQGRRGVPRIGFMGSGHGPNQEAAAFILHALAPKFPEARFEFMGSVCGALPTSLPPNVLCHGTVTESAKTRILQSWDIALNPIESGGGSSLKLPDYLAHGLATISTPTGARGFAVAAYQAGSIAPRPEFAAVLANMLNNPEEIAAQGRQARLYAAANLSWQAVTAAYRAALPQILRAPPPLPAPKLLVVTYRYTEPALGGAEAYLAEILQILRPRLARLDLAAIDLEALTNQHHFASQFATPAGGAARRAAALFDRSFYFAPVTPSPAALLEGCRALERSWAAEEQTLFAPFAAQLAESNQLRLFGGFFHPENHGGAIRRWTAPEFSFLLPQHACQFQMTGYAAAEKHLHITLQHAAADGAITTLAQHSQKIPPHFSITLALPRRWQGQALILHCQVAEHSVAGDHRPFGVLLESASILQDYHAQHREADAISELSAQRADLSELLDENLRLSQFSQWVAALHQTATARAPDMEAGFAAMRGPHAPALWSWLAQHASEYDAVLIQGIPFDVIPSAVETLKQLPKPPRIITLPHFHGDDRFYHWRRYFESFAAADANILFSPSIATHLGGAANLRLVPGGGVRLEDQTDIFAETRFREIYKHTAPFFLVLGRKTASKGYQEVIAAHALLRQSGAEIDLVLIGPDEDGAPLHAAHVHYLGRQPDAIVRGALAACLGLVTMSQSESFGIVLCEAWLFGKPVIANRACYAFRELVQHGETGLLVTTVPELASAMRSLSTDPARRARLGRAGFTDVLAKYSWSKVAEAFFDTI